MIMGDRVRLRAIEKEDLPHYVRWLNDPAVRQNLSMNRPLSLAEEENWFVEMLQKPLQERPLAIEIKPDPDAAEWMLVGGCSLMGFNWEDRFAEAGIHIGQKQYWDQGFGTEAIQLLCRHGFNDLNLHRIWLRVFANNLRAIRAYEKVGFIEEGKFREAKYLNGHYVDVVIMSILQPEWFEKDKGRMYGT